MQGRPPGRDFKAQSERQEGASRGKDFLSSEQPLQGQARGTERDERGPAWLGGRVARRAAMGVRETPGPVPCAPGASVASALGPPCCGCVC